MTQRRSLPALDRLESAIRSKITNLHEPKKKELRTQISEINGKRAKEIIADIERYAAEKYPELSIPLKCERAHSTVNSDNIQVGFNFLGSKDPLASQLKLFLVQEEGSHSDDLRILERWKMGCLQAMAAGEGFPPIGIAGLEDVSSEQKYYG
jgi:hypothetical protein